MNFVYNGLTKDFSDTVKCEGGRYVLTWRKGVDVVGNVNESKTIRPLTLHHRLTNKTKS